MTSRNLIPLSFLVCLSLSACGDDDEGCRTRPDYPAEHAERKSITQGIWGNVWFWSGDFMPICIHGTVTAVSREVAIYAKTPSDSLIGAEGIWGGFFSEVHMPLLATATSDADGFFQVSLPPGNYSLFVRENGLYYANWYDGQANVYPFKVIENHATQVRLDVTYEKSE